MMAGSGKLTLLNALKLMVRCLWARVPTMTCPPKTMVTSRDRSSVAYSTDW